MPSAGGLGVLGIGQVEADLRRVELVVARDGYNGLSGSSSATNLRKAASKAALPQAASANRVPPPGSMCRRRASRSSFVNENGGAAVKVDERVIDQVGVTGQELLVVDHHVEIERRLAEGVHQVGHGQRGDVPVAGMLELGDPQGACASAGSSRKSRTSRMTSLSAGSSLPVA